MITLYMSNNHNNKINQKQNIFLNVKMDNKGRLESCGYYTDTHYWHIFWKGYTLSIQVNIYVEYLFIYLWHDFCVLYSYLTNIFIVGIELILSLAHSL